MTNSIYLSKRGIKDIKKEITKIEHQINHEKLILKNLDSGNSYEERLNRIDQQSKIENLEVELNEKQYILEHAKPLPRKRDTIKAALGSIVDLVDNRGRKMSYTLVDSIETDPSKGKISVSSPLGKALMGKSANDVIEAEAKSFRKNNFQLIRVR